MAKKKTIKKTFIIVVGMGQFYVAENTYTNEAKTAARFTKEVEAGKIAEKFGYKVIGYEA